MSPRTTTAARAVPREKIMFESLGRLLITTLIALGLPALAQAQTGDELPDGPGKELVQAACVACHETDLIVASNGYTNDIAYSRIP